MKSWLIDFLIMNTFIIIPIYAILIISSVTYIIWKTIRFHFYYEKYLKKTSDLSKNIDKTITILKEESYNIKKDQEQTFEKMRQIRLLLENYFDKLKSIKSNFENDKKNIKKEKIR
jgi:hypothetical protein